MDNSVDDGFNDTINMTDEDDLLTRDNDKHNEHVMISEQHQNHIEQNYYDNNISTTLVDKPHEIVEVPEAKEKMVDKRILEHEHMYRQHHHYTSQNLSMEQEPGNESSWDAWEANHQDKGNNSGNISRLLENSTAGHYLENKAEKIYNDFHDIFSEANLTTAKWQQAQDNEQHLNKSLEIIKLKNEHINASVEKVEISKRNVDPSWPVHIDRFAAEELPQIGEPLYLTPVTKALLIVTLSLPVFALTIWMTLLYKAYKGRKPYKKRDHPELGDACLSQVVVESSPMQDQYKFLPSKATHGGMFTAMVARDILQDVINIPRKRSLEKKKKTQNMFY